MSETPISNQELQEDEILALSSIYNDDEFSYTKTNTIQCYYNVFCTISDRSLKLKNASENIKLEACVSSVYSIKYLPPVRMCLQLPKDYPTKSPPNFCIIASWMSPWQISAVCQKLDEMWLNNAGQQMLYLWFEFLRNELLSFLLIEDTLDVSFMSMTYCYLTSYFELNLSFQNDSRAIYSLLFLNPIEFLVRYNEYQCKVEFKRHYYTCNICLDTYYGEQCIQLKNCSHVYCKQCMQQYVSMKINEGTVNDITCPDLSCTLNITTYEIRNLCPDFFLKYENLLLKKSLNIMKDIAYCPRVSCQCPHVKNTDDTLAVCRKCDYAFCSYCYKQYHGVTPCAMTLSKTKKLIEEYQSSNKYQKELLRKKYGKKQMEIIVERHLTKEYLKKNAKACPNCETMISKIDGCNKMMCTHCKANFCWICGTHIITQNAYDHFLFWNNKCYRRLYEVLDVTDDLP